MTNLLSMTAAAAGTTEPNFLWALLPWVLIFVIFYMLMIRPQQKRMKEHQAQIAAAKKGDQVITAGGIRGRITKVMDEDVEVEIGQNMRVIVVKSTLSAVLTKPGKPAND